MYRQRLNFTGPIMNSTDNVVTHIQSLKFKISCTTGERTQHKESDAPGLTMCLRSHRHIHAKIQLLEDPPCQSLNFSDPTMNSNDNRENFHTIDSRGRGGGTQVNMLWGCAAQMSRVFNEKSLHMVHFSEGKPLDMGPFFQMFKILSFSIQNF